MRFLVERGGASVNAALTTYGFTALMLGSQNGPLETVRFLVERGDANVNAALATGSTALTLSREKGHLETVRFLVERGGASVNAALTVCRSECHVEVVLFLLQRGAHVNAARALCGRTPLMFASMTGHVAAVRLLLEHGALKRLTNHSGYTALDLAASHPLVLAALV